ncbi:hypothetical protein M0811_01302 [Anaeramoeba ignava]|uniref:NadR/Ttd14 AAA domain-containing protein n=1 Tax=Anaeramoeba ignava TaxID=1746090 RepID=A0A9Q0LGF5_ANAIG|nr:hypothetical protein M0811_01302 [Anaeramoeba ignava]
MSGIKVVCLEGPHGAGKTSLTAQFTEAGFLTLDEAFLDLESDALHPQTLTMEVHWSSCWFQRILKIAHKLKKSEESKDKNIVLVADRSPFSAVYYAKNGYLLEPVIKAQIKELRDLANISIYTVYIKVEKEKLWERIQERLKEEPERKAYNEDSRDWFEKTVEFYDNFHWDISIENNEESISKAKVALIKLLTKETILEQQPQEIQQKTQSNSLKI